MSVAAPAAVAELLNSAPAELARPPDHVTIPGGRLDDVAIEPFTLDVTEVTVGAYRQCVEAGRCAPAGTRERCSGTVSPAEGDRLPINCVTQAQAAAYCAWRGRRLPTGIEWTWAARGREEGRRYPWGDSPGACERANITYGIRRDGKCMPDGPWPVGSKPSNQSRDGVLDLQGNVAEWTAEWTSFEGSKVGQIGPGRERYGLFKGTSVFIDMGEDDLDPAYSPHVPAASASEGIGFRCAGPV